MGLAGLNIRYVQSLLPFIEPLSIGKSWHSCLCVSLLLRILSLSLSTRWCNFGHRSYLIDVLSLDLISFFNLFTYRNSWCFWHIFLLSSINWLLGVSIYWLLTDLLLLLCWVIWFLLFPVLAIAILVFIISTFHCFLFFFIFSILNCIWVFCKFWLLIWFNLLYNWFGSSFSFSFILVLGIFFFLNSLNFLQNHIFSIFNESKVHVEYLSFVIHQIVILVTLDLNSCVFFPFNLNFFTNAYIFILICILFSLCWWSVNVLFLIDCFLFLLVFLGNLSFFFLFFIRLYLTASVEERGHNIRCGLFSWFLFSWLSCWFHTSLGFFFFMLFWLLRYWSFCRFCFLFNYLFGLFFLLNFFSFARFQNFLHFLLLLLFIMLDHRWLL